MSFIHKRTYNILQGSNIEGELEEYFEVDELIALPIQELNRKGYITAFCCSGHAFPDSGEAFAKPLTKGFEDFIDGTYATQGMPDGSHRILYMNTPNHSSYIAFKDDSALPPVPPGWYYELRTLMRDYPDDLDEYPFFAVLVKSMKELYNWTLKLSNVGKQ